MCYELSISVLLIGSTCHRLFTPDLSSLRFSEAAVTEFTPKHPPEHTPRLYCIPRCYSGPQLAHVMLGAGLSLSSLSFNYQVPGKGNADLQAVRRLC